MKRSVDRILTTHAGSLPRPPDPAELMFAREDGQAVPTQVAARVRDAVAGIAVRQADAGVAPA
ncbi:MAG: hypothetical protein J2P39_05570 [Candidatus Dormibacteraeota bacterium]|nr:hypothetical protein [Candidatus Dormibacteraeota bacterium]